MSSARVRFAGQVGWRFDGLTVVFAVFAILAAWYLQRLWVTGHNAQEAERVNMEFLRQAGELYDAFPPPEPQRLSALATASSVAFTFVTSDLIYGALQVAERAAAPRSERSSETG